MTPPSAYQYALQKLTQREYAPKELEQKLANKNYPQEEINSALTRLTKEGTLSSQRYITDITHHWWLTTNAGPLWMSHKNARYHLKEETHAHLENTYSHTDWNQRLRTALQKKQSGSKTYTRPQLITWAQRKGYPLSLAFSIVDTIKEED